jgi:uncharacterized protein YdeI (YjbR/CyaY-like superfamily)
VQLPSAATGFLSAGGFRLSLTEFMVFDVALAQASSLQPMQSRMAALRPESRSIGRRALFRLNLETQLTPRISQLGTDCQSAPTQRGSTHQVDARWSVFPQQPTVSVQSAQSAVNRTSEMGMKQVYVSTRDQWRRWLAENHDRSEGGIWLVYFKKGTGQPSLNYEESVEEALCFGWIDSIIRTIDSNKYCRKFTPRKDGSKWSASNKSRVEKIIREGRMTEFGPAKVEAAKRSATRTKRIKESIALLASGEKLGLK